jgi:ABC-2 type transport system ATP-binding protein
VSAKHGEAECLRMENVSVIFRHRPALFNWFGNERGGETRALKGVSLSAPAGRILAVLGPNGSGKTTMLKLIGTTLLPTSGSIHVHGIDVIRHPERARRAVGFAVAAERSFYPRLTARENLDFFGALDNIPRSERAGRIEEVLNSTGLKEEADVLVMKFSSGMYQKLGIARALLKRPSLLLADEPSRSLDPGAAAQFWNLLRALTGPETTVVLTTHNFAEAAAVADAVVVLCAGTIRAHRQLNHASIDELRAFYFSQVEPETHAPALAGGGS